MGELEAGKTVSGGDGHTGPAVSVCGSWSTLRVGESGAGQRVDVWVARLGLAPSRSQAQDWLAEGRILVNENQSRPSYILKAGDIVSVHPPEPKDATLQPQAMPLAIVYEDDDLLVVNKPAGLVVHPAAGHPDRTLVNALLAHCPDLAGIGGTIRPGIVHRLDKDTSGLLVVAKNDLAQQSLSQQIASKTAHREYLAIVLGRAGRQCWTVDAPIGRHPENRKRMAVVPGGRPAVTHFFVRQRRGQFTLVEAHLETGRTHQIRVHLAYSGYPVVGDPLYGARRGMRLLERQALHAYRLTFTHPRTGAPLEFELPLAPDLQAFWDAQPSESSDG